MKKAHSEPEKGCLHGHLRTVLLTPAVRGVLRGPGVYYLTSLSGHLACVLKSLGKL